MAKPTLLAVLAHPDDESFGIGGTLATYASRGADVYLVCATRGEVGEVALIVAETEYIAQDAAERIAVKYAELPAYVDAPAAMADGVTLIHDDIPGNLAFDYEYGDRAATEPGFADAVSFISARDKAAAEEAE